MREVKKRKRRFKVLIVFLSIFFVIALVGTTTKITVTESAYICDKQTVEITNGLSINSLFDEVIGFQSLQVDAIFGATLTTNAHLKAIENALLKARID